MIKIELDSEQLSELIESCVRKVLKETSIKTIQNINEPEKLLTIQEAAQFLNLTVPTIYSKVSRGELPVMKRSKRLYFSSVQLMEYIKDGAKKSSSEIEAEAEAYIKRKNK